MPAIVEGASVLDGVAQDKASEYEPSERELGELIISPSALSGPLRVGAIEIDDPNANGRIDDRWYPPRLRESECAINVDMAPVPISAVVFIPGDPTDLFDEGALGGTMDLFDAPYRVAITVQLFDDESQRDALVATMQEFWAAWDEGLDCDEVDPGADLARLLGDLEEIDPVATEYPAIGIESGNEMMGRTTTGLYSVGDRVLLTVALTEGRLGGADGPQGGSLVAGSGRTRPDRSAAGEGARIGHVPPMSIGLSASSRAAARRRRSERSDHDLTVL